jgi:hypothetical protein
MTEPHDRSSSEPRAPRGTRATADGGRRHLPTGPAPREGLSALPGVTARVLAFVGVLVGGLCGAVIGYGVVNVSCTGDCTTSTAIGAIVGALITAIGSAVLAVLVLRAMSEWRALDRPLPPRRSTRS